VLFKIRNIFFFLALLLGGLVHSGHAQTNSYNGRDRIVYEGVPYYINGHNVPWNKFGGDFGNHELWGSLYDPVWFEKMFKDCQENGVNVVRLWIHCDGRANPEFDENGFCTGLDPDFFMDLDDCFRLAQKYEVMIMPCLWSFDMCKDSRESAGEYAGNHQDLLTDSTKMESYLQKCFAPMVKRYANQCNLFAWEVCNEPEWALDRTVIPADKDWAYRSYHVVPIGAMQKLTAKMASIVHRYSKKMVTTGSAAIRWNAEVEPSGIVNLWSDKMLIESNDNDSLSYLDFYQIHYYDHFKASGADPFDTTRTIDYWKFDKPTLIGETPASKRDSKVYTTDQMMDYSLKNGFAGVMFWSYNGGDGVGGWVDFKDANKKFSDNHPKLVHPSDFPCLKLIPDNLSLASTKLEKEYKLDWSVLKVAWVGSFELVTQNTDGTETALGVKMTQNGKNFSTTLSEDLIAKNNRFVLKQKDVFGYQNQTKPFSITETGIKTISTQNP
jgi:hypothetical protein